MAELSLTVNDPLPQDLRIARLAAELGPIQVHVPSLVQHVGRVSSWGGPFHETWDFARGGA